MAARLPSRKLKDQFTSPVLPSSETTDRRVPPVVYSVPFTASGVPSNLYSGRGPKLSVLNLQATSSLLKLDASIWSSGEYLVPLRSAVYCGHSPFFVDGNACWPNAADVSHASSVATTSKTRQTLFRMWPPRELKLSTAAATLQS